MMPTSGNDVKTMGDGGAAAGPCGRGRMTSAGSATWPARFAAAVGSPGAGAGAEHGAPPPRVRGRGSPGAGAGAET